MRVERAGALRAVGRLAGTGGTMPDPSFDYIATDFVDLARQLGA